MADRLLVCVHGIVIMVVVEGWLRIIFSNISDIVLSHISSPACMYMRCEVR